MRLRAGAWASPTARPTMSRRSLPDSARSIPRASIQDCSQLNEKTAGIATRRPMAVVTSASEIPPDTALRPPEPEAAIDWNEVTMPMTVLRRPTNGAVEEIVATMPWLRFIVRSSRCLLLERAPTVSRT